MIEFRKRIAPSVFTWVREALKFLCAEHPDHDPYRTWAKFGFTAKE
jgi:hypothetical protein